MLAKSVEIWIVGEFGSQAQILRLKDKRCSRRVKEDLTGLGASNREGKGVGLVVELQGGPLGAPSLRPGTGEDRFGNLVDIVGFVLNLDMETVICSLGRVVSASSPARD